MKNYHWLLAMYFLLPATVSSQVRIINSTSKQFTNAYLVAYEDSLKTNSICSFIVNKNQLKSVVKSGKEGTISAKLDPKKYYTLVLLDTSEYPNFYNHITFKYYLPGNIKTITVKEENIESDFWGHCEEGIEDKNLEDISFLIRNKSAGNLVKMYYRFDPAAKYERVTYLYQWSPVYRNATREIKEYDVKPEEARKLFIKCFIEKKGVLSEQIFEKEFEGNSTQIDLTIE